MKPKQTEKEKNWSYLFEEFENPSTEAGKLILGGKGSGLTNMTNLGLPVPPGFIITTEACNTYHKNDKVFPTDFWRQVTAKVSELETRTEKGFGNTENPLLLSVRSGSFFSMPGMMDTVLNLGLNDDTVVGLAAQTNDERFSWYSVRSSSLISIGIDYVSCSPFRVPIARFSSAHSAISEKA